MSKVPRVRLLLGLLTVAFVIAACAPDRVVVGSPRLEGVVVSPGTEALAGGVEDVPDRVVDLAQELPEGFSFDLAKGDQGSESSAASVAEEPGAPDPEVAGATLLLTAAEATSSAESYRFELMFSMEVSDASTQLTIAPDSPFATGAVSGFDSWTKIDMGPLFDAIIDGAEQGPETEAIANVLGGADLTMEAVTLGTETMYLRAPLLDLLADFGALPNADDWSGVGDGWAIVDLRSAGPFDVQEMASLTGAGVGSSAEGMLELLGIASAEVVTTEGVLVRGVPTTRFEARVGVGSMLEAQGAEPADLVRLVGGDALEVELPFDVYVDEDDRVRRIELSLDLEAISNLAGEVPPPGTGFAFSTTLDIFDYDAPVEVLAPPPDEVFADWTGAVLGLGQLAG